jgi:hypothetical protein
MDQRLYPQGKTPFYSKYVAGVLKFFKRADHSEIFSIDGTNGVNYEAGKVYTARLAATIAQVNAGATLVAAVPGYKIRLIAASEIAVGGAATGATTVDILGTQATSSVKLLAVAVAGLTENALVRDDHANSAILAAGASFVDNDANTALTVAKTGSNVATATHVHFAVTYTLVRA